MAKVKRSLLKYDWIYENGFVYLIDKQNNASFKLPIGYVDSFIRAGLSFKVVHRNEQLQKAQDKVRTAQERERKTKGIFTQFKVKALQEKRLEIEKRRQQKIKNGVS